MLSRRRSIMNRAARRYGRLPGQHGDREVPAFYPLPLDSNMFGYPFAKIKDGLSHLYFFSLCVVPFVMYWSLDLTQSTVRLGNIGTRPVRALLHLPYIDLDDPDHRIRVEAFEREVAANELEVRWHGSNYLASYLWQPGDPAPDIRRKQPPAHEH